VKSSGLDLSEDGGDLRVSFSWNAGHRPLCYIEIVSLVVHSKFPDADLNKTLVVIMKSPQ